jgi:hypothetical protein
MLLMIYKATKLYTNDTWHWQSYHLKLPKCATLNVIMYVGFHFKKLQMLTNSITLAISELCR